MDDGVCTRFVNTNKLIERVIAEQSILLKDKTGLQKEKLELVSWLNVEHDKYDGQVASLSLQLEHQQVRLKILDDKTKGLQWRLNCMLIMGIVFVGWSFWQ